MSFRTTWRVGPLAGCLVWALAGCGDDGADSGESAAEVGAETETDTQTEAGTSTDSGDSSSDASTEESSGDATTEESSTEESSSDESGGMCAMEGVSCAMGESCCEGTTCCAGVPVPPGSEFCSAMCPMSDRELKQDFAAVDSQRVLDSLVALPVTTWTYKDDPTQARHMGPMAQDFRAAFGVGGTDRHIFQVDGDGASIAAIQALNSRVVALDAENQGLRESVAALEARLDALER